MSLGKQITVSESHATTVDRLLHETGGWSLSVSWEKQDYKITALTLGLLVIPSANYYVYYSLLILCFLFLSWKGKVLVDRYSAIILIAFTYLAICSYLRMYLVRDHTIEDLKELIKFVPFLFVFVLGGRIRQLELKHLILALQIYLVLDALISFAQFYHIANGPLTFISDIYNRKGHAETALKWGSVRALGLSADPADHGAILISIFMIMCSVYLHGPAKSRYCLPSTILAILTLAITQSKTAIVTFLAVLPLFWVGYIANRRKATLRMTVTFVLFGIVGYLVYFFGLDYLSQLHKLAVVLDSGPSSVSSFDARIWTWKNYLAITQNHHPLWQFIGFGRTYMGSAGRVYDSDYVYICFVHGLVAVIVVYGYVFRFLTGTILKWQRQVIEKKVLFFVLAAGLVFGLGAAFLVSPKVSTLLALLLGMTFHPLQR